MSAIDESVYRGLVGYVCEGVPLLEPPCDEVAGGLVVALNDIMEVVAASGALICALEVVYECHFKVCPTVDGVGLEAIQPGPCGPCEAQGHIVQCVADITVCHLHRR